jgi:hypothetical protein
LETPSDATGVFNNNVGTEAQKYTCSRRLAMPQDENQEAAHRPPPKVART